MSSVRDRLALVISALGLAAVLLGGGLAMMSLGLADHWIRLWLHTVLLSLVLVSTAVADFRRRAIRLHRAWPLTLGVLMFAAAHLLVLAWLLSGIGAGWRMPQFMIVSVVEIMAFAIVLECAYRSCRRATGRRG